MCIFETERDREQAGEGQRDRETQNPKLQAPSCQHKAQYRARHRARTHEPTRSWPELEVRSGWRSLNRLSHPGTSFLVLICMVPSCTLPPQIPHNIHSILIFHASSVPWSHCEHWVSESWNIVPREITRLGSYESLVITLSLTSFMCVSV